MYMLTNQPKHLLFAAIEGPDEGAVVGPTFGKLSLDTNLKPLFGLVLLLLFGLGELSLYLLNLNG
jgi:hypothetical protein